MSVAENRRNHPDYSDDAFTPKPREADPLAELARLIGQSDPFADGARKPQPSLRADQRVAPEWLSRQPSDDYDDPHAPQGGYPAAHRDERYDDGAAYAAQDHHPHAGHFAESGHEADPHGEPAHDDTRGYQPDQRYRVAPPPPEEYEDSYYADDGHMPPQGEDGYAPPRRRGGLVTIAAVLGLAVVGTAGAFGYRAFTSGTVAPSTPPVIKADTTPAKIVPPALASADAQSKPFQDRIGAPAAPERVVSREEQPVSLPVVRQSAPPQAAFASANPASPPPLVAPPPTAAPGTFNEPKRVRTQTIRPDSSSGNDLTASPSPAPAPRGSAARQSGPIPIAPQSEPAPRTKMASRPAASAGGAYVVQVSAQKTEAEAQSSYRSLQQKYPTVLGGREPTIRRAEIGQSGVWYRVQVGSFSTSEQATAFCNNLKDAGGQCIVQRN
jgi:cell division protein FtsN